MSKTQKGRTASVKKVKKRVVTIMLTIQKMCQKNVSIFFSSFFKKLLGIFLLALYMLIMANKKMPENAEKILCENCHFKCSKKSNYAKHLLRLKHKNANNANEKMPENADENADKYFCEY